MEVRIDLRKTVPENARLLYEKSKKAKEKIPGIEHSIGETRRRLDGLRERIEQEQVRRQERRQPPEKRKWFEKFRWFTSSDGFLVVGGRDATSNEVLVKKHTEVHDTIFHADIQGAPFFVVKNPEGKPLPDATVREASEAAASYSSGWKAGVGAVDVYYVSPEQVSKTPESGEYLAKGAFVVRGKRDWARKVALKLAVGVERAGGRVVGGPASCIEKSCDVFAVIVPGYEKQGETAAHVKKLLEARFAGGVFLADVQKFIPGGRSKVIK